MTAPSLERARFNMIEQQVRPVDVLDPLVLGLLSQIKREEFVPAAHRAHAFADIEIPLLADAEAAQSSGRCMLSPKLVGRMVQAAALRPTDKVLEVGTGTGYTAAVLAGAAADVTSLEIDSELASQARANLQRTGVRNVQVREADGAQGYAAAAPYDAIVLSGSVAQIPQGLLAQLRVGGRLVAVVGHEPMMRLTVITRRSDQQFDTQEPWDTCAPRLQGFTESSGFRF